MGLRHSWTLVGPADECLVYVEKSHCGRHGCQDNVRTEKQRTYPHTYTFGLARRLYMNFHPVVRAVSKSGKL